MIAKITQCLLNVTLTQIRAYIASSILFCECYRTGVAAEDIYKKVQDLKKQRKQHRGGVRVPVNMDMNMDDSNGR